MLATLGNLLLRLFTTRYAPDPTVATFLKRAEVQEAPGAKVTAAVLDAAESERYFGLPLARRGIQPLYLHIENKSSAPLRLQLVRIDPNYFTALEVAAANHFSVLKRMSMFGLLGQFIFFPLLWIMPFKLITAYRANRRMDDYLRTQALHLRPIPPGGAAKGFVFTPLDLGTKVVQVSLHAGGDSLDALTGRVEDGSVADQSVLFTFSLSVPGIAADYLHRGEELVNPVGPAIDCQVPELVDRLQKMPPATSNRNSTRSGDPVNLVVIGDFATILAAFAARWDESETITLKTCWKTARSFLLGSQYRYSPVSPLFLFGRSQDVALQRTRRSINERLHLRLWLTELRFQGAPVWVGQISRDIGVRFTHKTWNLTTHRIDPDTDEARDYVIEDLFQAERLHAAGYVDGVGPCDGQLPRRNLTGDPYYTDGKRAVIVLSPARTTPRFVALS